MNTLIFKSIYEESGYFDKDAQGWCAYIVEIACEDGKNVTIRRFFDANGYIADDNLRHGIVQEISNDVVTILLERGEKLYYSLQEKRLVIPQ
ncbi:MAG: hypothetical protein OHK0057_32970 [Thermoflexibacter sp.]